MQNPATAGKCGLSLSFIFQDQLNMLAQFWDILLYSVPHCCHVNAEIIMYQNIPESYRLFPFNERISIHDPPGNVFGGFTDYFEILITASTAIQFTAKSSNERSPT